MHLGLQISDFHWLDSQKNLSENLTYIVEQAERAGFYSLWVMDHFFQIEFIGRAEEEMLESWSTLAFAAARTHRIKLGTLVSGVTYRYPSVLVKMATTLDVLSQGRTYFGIGAAWYEKEHKGLGIPFPTLSERFQRLEETIQIAKQMWSGNQEPYNGRYYHLEYPLNMPPCIQKPHPPILIGGAGEQKTLRLVAQYADACNFFAWHGEQEMRHKLAVLHNHCHAVGRPYEQIEKTSLSIMNIKRNSSDKSLSPEDAINSCKQLARLGIDQAIIKIPNILDPEVFDLISSRIIPEVEKIRVAGRS